MDKLIITAALTGNITLPTQTPYLPFTPEQIAEEALRCANAGAASVHVHARDPETGRPSTDPQIFREIATLIKVRTNLIFCPTTGGTADMTAADRIQVVPALKPELATCNMGSINFSIHPIVDRYKDEEYKFPWEKEFAASTKNFVFRNTFGNTFIKRCKRIILNPNMSVMMQGICITWLSSSGRVWSNHLLGFNL
jgi:uncharacterized protein (DUF849 family)